MIIFLILLTVNFGALIETSKSTSNSYTLTDDVIYNIKLTLSPPENIPMGSKIKMKFD